MKYLNAVYTEYSYLLEIYAKIDDHTLLMGDKTNWPHPSLHRSLLNGFSITRKY